MRTIVKFIFVLSFIPLFITCSKNEARQPDILFLLADDWSYPYSEIYGESYIKTPNLVKLSQSGVVFENAYCSSPSCTPSRASMLTGRYPHNLGEGANLCGRLDVNIPTYVQVLRENGYTIAFDRKGWAPGDFTKMGYTQNPCGDKIEFSEFLDKLPEGKPFFFWFGTNDPHRPFDKNAGKTAGIDVESIKVPGFLPDTPEIRQDLVNYFSEIQHFDKEIGDMLELLKKAGRLENTVIIIASDNGMPFPHAKANLYDYGTRVPLIISGFSKEARDKRNNYFVNFIDLAPTFLDIAGVKNQPVMDGKSLMPILKGEKPENRDHVFLERERHCLCRAEMSYGAGYPMRAIRTNEYLYIQNFRPDRNPAGDETIPGTPSEYGDVDGGITKVFMMDNRNNPLVKPFFELGFGKRPAEELYVLKDDPYNIHNVVNDTKYSAVKADMQKRLGQWMKESHDPRLNRKGDEIDLYAATTCAWITRDSIIFLDE